MKYKTEVKKLALKLAVEIKEQGQAKHQGKTLTCLKDIQAQLGPNPLAVKRYAIKFGGDITGVPRKISKKNKLVTEKK